VGDRGLSFLLQVVVFAHAPVCGFVRAPFAYIQLLFTVLKHSDDPSLRATISIALGDLAFRFPNLIEPWTGQLYGRLRDLDARVRKNTLMVLTHLILNDMIKVCLCNM
jgi:hypothetical protein